MPITHVEHDLWISMTAYYTNKRIILNTALQYYRRHGGNVSKWVLSGANPPSFSKLFIPYIFTDSSPRLAKTLLLLQLLLKRLAERLPQTLECVDVDFIIRQIEDEIRLLERGLKAVSKPRLQRVPTILGLLASGSYTRAMGWKSALRDLLAPRASLPAALLSGDGAPQI